MRRARTALERPEGRSVASGSSQPSQLPTGPISWPGLGSAGAGPTVLSPALTKPPAVPDTFRSTPQPAVATGPRGELLAAVLPAGRVRDVIWTLPGSALHNLAAELCRKHRAGPAGVCSYCQLRAPCPTRVAAGQVILAAGGYDPVL
jgi:hypothetical protein